MKLLVVTQYFYPENFRINDLCAELVKRGHEVTVYTGIPNYPNGFFYPGYSFIRKKKEIWNGIKIIRSPLLPRKKGKVHLILNYFSFAFIASLKAHFIKWEKYDVIYVFETSPITVALPAITIKKLTGIPIIMNVQDLWPDNVVAITGWKSPLVLSPLNKLVNYIYSKCDLILASSKSFIPNICSHGPDKAKVKFWPQFSVVQQSEKQIELLPKESFHIMFTGNLGEAQNLELMIEAAALCQKQSITWHLIGDGRNKDTLEQLVIKYGLQKQVLFHGRKEEQLIPEYLKSANAALLILKPNPVFDNTIPAKLQTYLACGIPVLASVRGEAKKLIEQEHVGLTCSQQSAECLANQAVAMSHMSKEELKKYAKNALDCSEKYFNKEQLVTQLENYMLGVRNKTCSKIKHC